MTEPLLFRLAKSPVNQSFAPLKRLDVSQGSSFKIVLAQHATLGTVSVFAAKHFYKLGLVEEHNGKFFATMLSGFSACPNTNQELQMPQNGRTALIPRFLSIALLISPIAIVIFGQSAMSGQHPERPTPPTRDPNSPGYVKAKELADGSKLPAST